MVLHVAVNPQVFVTSDMVAPHRIVPSGLGTSIQRRPTTAALVDAKQVERPLSVASQW